MIYTMVKYIWYITVSYKLYIMVLNGIYGFILHTQTHTHTHTHTGYSWDVWEPFYNI